MSSFLEALQGRRVGPPPIWLMRQAGRYLPAYRVLRERHSFLELLGNPETIAQVTLLPFEQFSYDAAVLFTDILAVLWGLGGSFEVGDGIRIRLPKELTRVHPHQAYGSLMEGIRLLKPQLKVPLIGVVGGPWTVTTYLIERQSPGEALNAKNHPDLQTILGQVTEATIEFAQAQIDAGVDVVQIFDTWASLLSPSQWRQIARPALQRLISAIDNRVPVILFCRGSAALASDLAQLQLQGLGVDWQSDLHQIRRQVGPKLTLQGNLDPSLLLGDRARLVAEARQMVSSMAGDPRYIANLGHGILPQTPLDAVQVLLDTVREAGSA